MSFSLKFKEEAVELEQENGEFRELAVREMNGRVREEYLGLVSKKGKRTAHGFEVTDYNGFTTALLERCLYWKDGAEYVKVTKKEILEFPSTLVEELTKVANDLNGFKKDADDEDAEGN